MSEFKMFYDSDTPMVKVMESVTTSSTSKPLDRRRFTRQYRKMISDAVNLGYHKWWISRFSIKRDGRIVIKAGMGKQKVFGLEKYKQMMFDKSLPKRFSDAYSKIMADKKQ